MVANLVEDQVERGWDVAVASPEISELGSMIAHLDARRHAWRATRAPHPGTIREARDIARLVALERPDLVHLHSAKAGLAGRLALRGRFPTVFEPNAWSFEALRGAFRRSAIAWERRAARWTDALICVSRQERAEAEAVGISAPFEVVPNGIDLDAWPAPNLEDRAVTRSELELPEGAPLVVCVGRLSEQKGQDVLLKAWPAVIRSIPDARLALVGDGPYRERLLAQEVRGVSLVGSRRDVRRWFVAADVVAIPSRWEGMSLGMLEAMATARSIVSTRVSGTEEALGNGVGAIVDAEDPSALAEELLVRLEDPDLAAREGRRARERAERDFDASLSASRVADVYRRVLERRNV